MTLFGAFLVLFVGLKLGHVIDWTWPVVFWPVYVWIAWTAIVFGIAVATD